MVQLGSSQYGFAPATVVLRVEERVRYQVPSTLWCISSVIASILNFALL